MNVGLLDRMQSIPKRKPARNDQSDKNADQKEPPISWEHDQQNPYDKDGNDETRRSFQADPQAESRAAARFRLHEIIL